MAKTLGEIYGLKKDEERDESPSVHQFNVIVDKTIDELNEEDVAYMLRQRFIAEVSIVKAKEFLSKNPFAGKEYEGELLWSLASWDPFPSDYKDMIKEIIPNIEEEAKEHEYEDDDIEIGYIRTIHKLKNNLK